MSGADVCRNDEERQRRYLDRQEKKTAARNAWKTAERIQNMQDVIDVLNQMHSGTVRQVTAVMGKSHSTVKKWIHDLHEQKVLFVFDHVMTEGCPRPVPVYRVGDLPDKVVEKKKPVEESEEEMDGAWRKHEAWKKTWVPHCDPAAAWMMGATT